jgi:hypothetical protein
MNRQLCSFSSRIALFVLILATSRTASPNNSHAHSSDSTTTPRDGWTDESADTIDAIGEKGGIEAYLALHRGHNLTGCAASTPHGPELFRQGDKHSYVLVGDVAGIKFGDRIRVSGWEEKEDAGGVKQFVVDKVSKDFGACVARSTRSRSPVTPIGQTRPPMQ